MFYQNLPNSCGVTKITHNGFGLGEEAETDANLKHEYWCLAQYSFEILNGFFAKPLLPAGRIISRNLNNNKMKVTGLKLICERADGEITTWHDVFETTVEDVIKKVRYQKRWFGGRFLEAYLEFDNDGQYYKVYLDVKDNGFNQLLGS